MLGQDEVREREVIPALLATLSCVIKIRNFNCFKVHLFTQREEWYLPQEAVNVEQVCIIASS